MSYLPNYGKSMNIDRGKLTIPEKRAYELLNLHGFSVEKIPEADSKRCDFFVRRGEVSFFLEVKERNLSSEESKRAKQSEIYIHPEAPLGYNKRIKRIMHDGVSQINETSEHSSADYKLVWFDITDDFDSFLNYDRLFSTVYGIRRLSCLSRQSKNHIQKACLYFTHSVFFTSKELNGILLCHNSNKSGVLLELLVNRFSPNYSQFINSEVCDVFRQVCRDPNDLDERFITADCDLDRNDEAAILRYVAAKYGYSNLVLNPEMGDHAATFTINIA